MDGLFYFKYFTVKQIKRKIIRTKDTRKLLITIIMLITNSISLIKEEK